MDTTRPFDYRYIAEQCVSLVETQHELRLDWSLASLDTLDGIVWGMLEDGPLNEERLDLWCKLLGAYMGEVIIGAYGGEWAMHEQETPCVKVSGITAFPFGNAYRVLRGEPYKTLGSFGRALPAIIERSAMRE